MQPRPPLVAVHLRDSPPHKRIEKKTYTDKCVRNWGTKNGEKSFGEKELSGLLDGKFEEIIYRSLSSKLKPLTNLILWRYFSGAKYYRENGSYKLFSEDFFLLLLPSS